MAKKQSQPAVSQAIEYTSRQIADIRGCKKVTVNLHARRLIAEGKITGRKIAQTMVYSQSEADLIIDGIRSGPGNPQFAETGENRPKGYGRWAKKQS